MARIEFAKSFRENIENELPLVRDAILGRVGCRRGRCWRRWRVAVGVCTENLDSDVTVMEAAEERMSANASDPLNWARDRRILVQ